MATYKDITLPNTTREPSSEAQFPLVKLKWRRGQLLVSSVHPRQRSLPLLRDEQWLVECLKRSLAKLLVLDASLGEESLNFWANACEKASMPVFLRPSTATSSKQRHSLLNPSLTRLLDWSIAALLLMVLSPVMVGLIFLLRRRLPQAVLRQEWHVGKRGKLFRPFKFCTTVINARTCENKLMNATKHLLIQSNSYQPLEHWMCKYRLDKLPQLFNVLRGEMSLLEPYSMPLKEAVRLSLLKRQ